MFELRELITQLICAIRFSFKLEQFSLKNDRKSVSKTPIKHQKSNAERDIPSKTGPEVSLSQSTSSLSQYTSSLSQSTSDLSPYTSRGGRQGICGGALGGGRGGEATLDSLLT